MAAHPMRRHHEIESWSRKAAIPKAINLDLSCNTIVTIPKSFASSLTRLVKLDLSKNQITALPDNFGLLVNLKHLDLDNNRLESLPLSFGNLRSLRWLDLKCNPLMPRLAQIAGLCLDAKQCQAAARNVVAALRTTQEQVEAEISRLKEEQLKKDPDESEEDDVEYFDQDTADEVDEEGNAPDTPQLVGVRVWAWRWKKNQIYQVSLFKKQFYKVYS
ncbi:Leucine Rich repeats (2 copies) [Homalodisca vitripennis]|nr:Leucine Rich repeats (2 copies) [Homalodisca vitripennis]